MAGRREVEYTKKIRLYFVVPILLLLLSACGKGTEDCSVPETTEKSTKAVSIREDEEEGSTVTWEKRGDALYFSGEGRMISSEGLPWQEEKSKIYRVVIEDGVTSICDGAFSMFENLRTVKIGNSVTKIGKDAFSMCDRLTTVNFPQSLSEIGEGAFSFCDRLYDVRIPGNVRTIGKFAFLRCTRIQKFNVSPENTYFETDENGVLYRKGGQTLFLYPYGCRKTDFVVPDTVTNVSAGAFAYCDKLRSVSFPDGTKTIGESAFYNCNSLRSVILPTGLQTIASKTFANSELLEEIHLPQGLSEICEEAFDGCRGLTAMTIPEGVDVIGRFAFRGCEKLEITVLGREIATDGWDIYWVDKNVTVHYEQT